MFAVGEAFSTISSLNSFIYSLVKAALMYSNKSSQKVSGLNLDKPLPQDLPSAVDIKKVIPKYCFEPTVARSMYYAVKDSVQIAAAWVMLWYILAAVEWFPAKVLIVLFYWALQGTFMMGMFVMGHDCGHGSFSKHTLLNDIVGTVSHSFLYVPYYQWKLSHRNHHKFTGNMDKDEVFYPTRGSQDPDFPVLPGFGYGLGWYIYLAIGYFPRRVRHYTPISEAFQGHMFGCCCSLACLSCFTYLWVLYCMNFGFLHLLISYLVPLFVFGSYVVIVTFLHHTELNVPWYGDEKWNFVKGQLSTVDRHYGVVHDLIHCIGTHQVHHLFTKIPHYHLEEATTHFRKAFPNLAKSCSEPIMTSFVRMFKKYVAQSKIGEDVKEMKYE